MKAERNGRGRPTKVTPDIVTKLEEGFSMGFTDEEACLYADISRMALHRYIEKNPEFRDRKEILKRKPHMKAKLNIAKDLNREDVSTSKWYLEHKDSEFSKKSENRIVMSDGEEQAKSFLDWLNHDEET